MIALRLFTLSIAWLMLGNAQGIAANAANASAFELVEMGNAAYQAGRFDDALKHYNEASVANPESPELYFNQGTVHYQKGDYEAATKAFADAALRGKEPKLEANARYNQGNCAFREAERQRDSDLNKAIEACRDAIGFYQDALQLDSAKKQAAENIEIVRLYVKALLDEQQKKQEEQQQQDDLGKKLKELLERQIEEIKGSATLGKAQPAAASTPAPAAAPVESDPLASSEPQLGDSAVPEENADGKFNDSPAPVVVPTASPASEAWAKSVAEHATNQMTLQQDTVAVLDGMRQMETQMQQQAAAPPQPGQPSPAPDGDEMAQKLGEAIGHVGESVDAQGGALQSFSAVTAAKDPTEQTQSAANFTSAQQQQQQSAQHLAQALQALSDPQQDQNQDDQDKKDQDGDQQEQNDDQQKGDQDQQQKDGEDGENKDQQKQDDQKEGDEKKEGEEGDDQKDGKSGKEGEEQEEKEQPQSALKPAGDSADDILNEEKENQKRRMPVRTGGVRPVDKDW
ncbi:MAG: tetratricopeptide (TPR) repeat protein [Verrucomicrobiales bacterium]|jgi:tetratricopeptide (TPR) repeat protein